MSPRLMIVMLAQVSSNMILCFRSFVLWGSKLRTSDVNVACSTPHSWKKTPLGKVLTQFYATLPTQEY